MNTETVHHSSIYIILYNSPCSSSESSITPVSLDSLPDHVQAHVKQDRQQFEDWVVEMGKMKVRTSSMLNGLIALTHWPLGDLN